MALHFFDGVSTYILKFHDDTIIYIQTQMNLLYFTFYAEFSFLLQLKGHIKTA